MLHAHPGQGRITVDVLREDSPALMIGIPLTDQLLVIKGRGVLMIRAEPGIDTTAHRDAPFRVLP